MSQRIAFTILCVMRGYTNECMASITELTDTFAIPGVLAFDEPLPGFPRARISSPVCTAELYLHGAHLTQWQPAQTEAPVLYLSPRSLYAPGKAIRGGVPVIFPWFGPRAEQITGHRTGGTQHGFARTSEWELTFAAAVGDEVHLVLTLGPSDQTRSEGFDQFRAALEFRLGRELHIRMTVANEGNEPLIFEQALHTYLYVGDVEQIKLSGLGGTEYLDKTDGLKRKTQDEDPLVIRGEVDRPYLNTTATVTVDDPTLARKIVVSKAGSRTTVVWNPAVALTATLQDLTPDAWVRFVCVETANASENLISLGSRAAHTMEAHIAVESF